MIRPMVRGDLDEVLEIERAGYSFPWTEALFRDCFRADYRLWVLQRQGILCGYAVVAYLLDEAHLLNLCTRADLRRRGIACELLHHLMSAAADDDMTAVTLEVRVSNEAAAALYTREGFATLGRRPDYYPAGSDREDAWVMSRPLARVRSAKSL